MHPGRVATLFCGIASMAMPVVVRAQRSAAMLDAARACLHAIPASELSRVIVYVSADARGRSSDRVVPAVDALVSAVADRVRARFGKPAGVLPSGDSLVTWIGLGSDLRIVARRGTPLRWTYTEAGEISDGMGLLVRALQQAVADGETFVWPDDVTADSVIIDMRLDAPEITRAHTAVPITSRAGVAVFTLPIPWTEHAQQLAPVRADVPRSWTGAPMEGYVFLGVVVDTAGRVDPELIRELGPLDDKRQPLPALKAVWAEARHQATLARFTPERIGGCAVPTPFRLMIPYTIE